MILDSLFFIGKSLSFSMILSPRQSQILQLKLGLEAFVLGVSCVLLDQASLEVIVMVDDSKVIQNRIQNIILVA